MRAGAFDAGAGDVVGIARQALLLEQGGAALDHALIEDVDVLEVDPRPDAMVAQAPALARERGDQLVEHRLRLCCGAGGGAIGAGAEARAPEMREAAFLNQQMLLRHAMLGERRAAVDVIGQQRELRAGERRLLHDRDRNRAVRGRAEEPALAHRYRLVHHIADEDTSEDGAVRRELQRLARLGIALLDAVDLFGKTELRRGLDADEMLGIAGRAEKAPAGDPIVLTHLR